MLERKAIGPLTIKNADAGEVTATLATLGVVDEDGDVILPEVEVEGERVKLSDYEHDVVLRKLAPVGKGRATAEGNELTFQGIYFLSTWRGREAFETVKALGPDSEWSFGYKITKRGKLTEEWKARGAKRVIAGIKVVEASPVLQGAGVGTGTTGVKNDGSLSRRVEDVAEAAWRQLMHLAEDEAWGVVAVFEDHVIVRAGLRLLRVPYTVEGAAISFGEPEEVRIDYVPMEAEKAAGPPETKQARARTPTFAGTSEGEWLEPTLADYRKALDLPEDVDWKDLSEEDRGRVVVHTLIGSGDAETFDRANFFPVVDPRSGELNANALRAAISRAPQADIPAETAESVQAVARRLLDEEFGDEDKESKMRCEECGEELKEEGAEHECAVPEGEGVDRKAREAATVEFLKFQRTRRRLTVG